MSEEMEKYVTDIMESLMRRQGIENVDLLNDMILDSICETRALLNYGDEEILPEGINPVVKELTLIRINRDGTEGIQTETQSSGGSTTYSDELPERTKRLIRRYRRIRR